MFENAYRQRLEADLARWQADGIVTPVSATAIRASLGPLPRGINIATVVAMLGGLLIAAAFLAFIAANWATIARPARFVVLLAGIAGAYGLGAFFVRGGLIVLSDLAATVGCIVYGAAIALVGQMYHLGDDFSGGLLLWASGALVAAVLTVSRGALAVALVAACVWSGMRVADGAATPDLPFLAFWFVGAVLAVFWNAPSARHLVALAALSWWLMTGFGRFDFLSMGNPAYAFLAGGVLMLGGGLTLSSLRLLPLSAFGLTLSTYGAFVLALASPVLVSSLFEYGLRGAPEWLLICAATGAVLAFVAAALGRRLGPIFAGLSAGLILIVLAGYARLAGGEEPWFAYALALLSMLCLIVSGMLDDVRPRVVAGWLGLGSVIVAITWAVKGSLLRRSVFLAAAGGAAVLLALLLGRLMPKEETR